MKRTKLLTKVLAVCMAITMLAGCGNAEQKEKESSSQPKESSKVEESSSVAEEKPAETVNIRILSLINEQPDQQRVFDALNEYTKEKINITCTWEFMGGAFYDKIGTIIASGEEFDACFTSNWTNSYAENVAKGAFVDISDRVAEVAPGLYDSIAGFLWDAATIDGACYAVPNQQIVARQLSIQMPKSVLDGTGMKAEDITNLTNAIPYLEKALDEFGAKASIDVSVGAEYCGYEMIHSTGTCAAIKRTDSSAKVVNFYLTDEFKAMLTEVNKLYELGLMRDVSGDFTAEQLAQKISAAFTGTYKPGVEAEESAAKGYDMAVGRTDQPAYVTTGNCIATMQGISATSKHVDETLKYLELINSDPYAMNLLSYGIEDVHYKKTSDNVIEMIPDSGYNHGSSWAIGNVFNTYALSNQPADIWEQTEELNNTALVSPLMGFTFNAEPVKVELANVSTVFKEYLALMNVGEFDPADLTEDGEFNQKLMGAGLDKVMEEMQKQIDAFLASK